jgi:hypothetical protein
VIEHGIASGLTLEADKEDLIDQVAKVPVIRACDRE